jgi:hypothetical protein
MAKIKHRTSRIIGLGQLAACLAPRLHGSLAPSKQDALSFVCFLMANAKSLYVQLSGKQKRRLLAVLTPCGFTLDEREGFRTVASECLFNGLYAAATVSGEGWGDRRDRAGGATSLNFTPPRRGRDWCHSRTGQRLAP